MNHSCVVQKTIIELFIILYLILALLQNVHYIVNCFCIASLCMHFNQVINVILYPTMCQMKKNYTTHHKIMMLSIACYLVFICLTHTHNLIIINLGWFVLFSKLLDFFSNNDTLFEEVTTLILSIILTSLSVRAKKTRSGFSKT